MADPRRDLTLLDLPPHLIASIDGLVSEAIRSHLPKAIDEALHQQGFSNEVAGLIHLLAARANDSKDATLEKALTLYGLALDAREKGNRLAILNQEDQIIHDVVGFDAVPV